jgi:hypothetical protein
MDCRITDVADDDNNDDDDKFQYYPVFQGVFISVLVVIPAPCMHSYTPPPPPPCVLHDMPILPVSLLRLCLEGRQLMKYLTRMSNINSPGKF